MVIGRISLAQVYPVQATVQLTPPYSLYLADYVESGTERLALNIFLADIARPSLDVRFRLRIVGQGVTIETKPEYRPAPISIQGGVPMRLISTDLADYFNSNNLNFQGITRREYDQRGKLPEGVYQFCFEVLEYNRGAKISNTACGTAWMILNDPPIVNLPRQNEKLKVQSPQNILLQWTPRHTGSPNSAFTTNYDVTMVEVWPSTRNPNDAILTSPPIFETTTSSTTVVYGPAETPLEPGRRYAFRVRARSIAGVDELDLFKNNGYSEVISFVYGDACDLPTGINATSIGTSKFSLAWDGLFNHTAYRVRYREAGTTNWYENNVTSANADIYSLKPATVYEYQVAATCGFYDGQYSTVAKVTTNPLPEAAYACGAPMGAFNIDPKELTGSLKAGDIIQAGDFDVKLTKVTGSNGVFSGEGVIEVPYFNKAKVKTSFSDISVNKELRMVNGYMNVTGAAVDIIPAGVTDAMNTLTEVLNTADSALNTIEENLPEQFDPNSFVADSAITVKNGISSVYKDTDGSVVIVDNKGTETRLPAGTSAAVKDDNGNGYLVDKKGNVHKVTADVAAKAGNREYNLSLKFAANANMQYGFDQRKYDAIGKDYEQLKNYSVAWKSVASGGVTDVVTAILSGTGVDANQIKFEQSGVALQAQPFANNQTTLSVRGGSDGTEEGLLALYSASDTGKVLVLGKLNVVSYNKISNSVVIVPVNTTTLPSGLTPQIIEDSLNAIYKQAVVDWKVSIASPIEVALGDSFDDGDSELLSNYTDDMKKVIKFFGKLQDETFYLFLVNNPKSSDGLGYMPRGKQAGFIFVDRHGADKSALMRTMAHELGHGAFGLHHTFKEPNFTLTKGATDNLMDYPSGNKLYKYQWDKMRYTDIVIGLFEEDEEGKNAIVVNIEGLKDFANRDAKGNILSYTFLARSGEPISLPPTITSVTFSTGDPMECDDGKFSVSPFGSISSFKFIDEKGKEKEYAAYWRCKANQFIYYKSDNDIYYDVLTNSSITKAIVGFPAASGGDLIFKVGQIDVKVTQQGAKYTAEGPYQPFDFLADKVKGISKYNEIYASFSPDYDENVRKFILDNIKKEGFDGNAFYDNDIYVFTHATQLQRYNILEGCFKTGVPGELLKLITESITTTTGSLTYVPPTTQEYPVFQNSYEEGADKANAKSLINHWRKYDLNYYPATAKAVNNFNIPENATAEEVYSLLKPLAQSQNLGSDNWNCFWNKIGVEQRVKLIRQLAPEDLSPDQTEEMLFLLISTLEGQDKQLQMLDSLQANNYSLFRMVWNVLDNNDDGRIRMGILLSNWLAKHRLPPSGYAEKVRQNFWLGPKDTESNGTNTNFFLIYRMESLLGSDYIPLDFSFTTSNQLHIKHDVDPFPDSKPDYFDWTGGAFDWVAVSIMDDFPEGNLKKGTVVAVPAILLLGLDNRFDYQKKMRTIRVIGDVAAIALAPLTAGGSTVIFAIEVSAAIIDIAVTVNRDELDKYLGPEAAVVWDVMYGAWNIFTLGKGFFVPTTTTVQGVARISGFRIMMQKADEVAEAIANHGNTAEKLAYLERLEELLNVLRTQKFSEVGHAAELFSKVLELKLKVERTLKTGETIITIIVKDGNLVVNNTLSLGKIDFIANVPTITQSTRWLPASITNIKLIDQYSNVATVVDGVTSVGMLSVVQDLANPSQCYIIQKLMQGAATNSAFLSKTQNWLNGITTAATRTGIENIIKTWSSNVLQKLEQGLGKYPALGPELTADTKLLDYFKGIYSSEWYKWGLLRDHYKSPTTSIGLPENFRKIAEELPVSRSDPGRLISTELAQSGDKIQTLGRLFEEALVPEVGRAFASGDFSNFPAQLSTELQALYNDGYNIVVTQATVAVPGAGAPRPDMLLFRFNTLTNTVDLQEVVVFDSKLNALAAYEAKDAQRDLALLQGTNTTATIQTFSEGFNPQIYTSAPGTLTLRTFEGQQITIKSFGKIGTIFESDLYTLTQKPYNPRP
ncbi:MAG TPA: fibronectin type III domain-containing protein [Ohtaekwangia sp.]